MSTESTVLTVHAVYSDKDCCVCCKGNHRCMTFLTDINNNRVDAGDFVQRLAVKMEHGQKIKVTVERFIPQMKPDMYLT